MHLQNYCTVIIDLWTSHDIHMKNAMLLSFDELQWALRVLYLVESGM